MEIRLLLKRGVIMQKSSFYALKNVFESLPVKLELKGEGVDIDFSEISRFAWKGKPARFSLVESWLKPLGFLTFDEPRVSFSGKVVRKDLLALLALAEDIREDLSKENPEDISLWGKMKTSVPTGFSESGEGSEGRVSAELLNALYEDDYVVKEKKAFVLDLKRSQGMTMLATGPERETVLDSASQIASMALGFNDAQTRSMALRPELKDPNLDLEAWDVTHAYRRLLKEKSGLGHVAFLNSGAEAVEAGLRACQRLYPDRKKIIAFEGSFHGRTLLALHATHSPAKRTPFEIYPGQVSFLPFPEDKLPHEAKEEPKDWLSLWEAPESSDFQKKIQLIERKANPLLREEIEALLKVRETILMEKPLAVLIEPMLCEGGDRYGTPRFFRALRLLTRSLDVPLVFDEVQTGLGLGGAFFWHHLFDLKNSHGEKELPDVICLAKKAQVGVCLSRFDQELCVETSAASLYRGYLNASCVDETDFERIESQVRHHLFVLQDLIGEELIRSPRNKGLAFAFDLPSAEILNQLISRRFLNGLLFYPAGEKTARFRMMFSSSAREIDQTFLAIYRCIEDISQQGGIPSVPPLKRFAEALSSESMSLFQEEKGIDWELPWGDFSFPKNKEAYLQISQEEWRSFFSEIIREYPQMLHSPLNQEFTLDQLLTLTPEELWRRYADDQAFTFLDLCWQSSRAFGDRIERLEFESAKNLKDQMQELEEELYEPERQDDPEHFIRLSKDPRAIFLVARADLFLRGMCIAAPLKDFSHLDQIQNDPLLEDSRALYSADLSLRKVEHGRGLGLRLKCEQYLEGLSQGASVIRSRNRVPEAKPMAMLNKKLSAVVFDKNDKDYGGKGTSVYQSITLPTRDLLKVRFRLQDPILPIVRNKTSLANFISPSYLANLLLLKETLPQTMRHVYLSNGRAEAVDKTIKLLRSARPEARFALSLEGDFFGNTTASGRSLGSHSERDHGYFDWPVLRDPGMKGGGAAWVKEVLQQADQHPLKECFGFFLEPIQTRGRQKREQSALELLIKELRKRELPIVFAESASGEYQYHEDAYFCSGPGKPGLEPDVMMVYPGAQVGLIAVKKEFFLAQPLMMISTWDGDEQSLNLFVKK
jgi:4-aminobutyrate aminotransferase-like enzyme